MSSEPEDMFIKKAAMSIVNHILEAACTPVEVRQGLNDELDAFVIAAIKDVHATLSGAALK